MKANAAVASRYNGDFSVLIRNLVPAHVAVVSRSSVTLDALLVRPNEIFVFQAVRRVIDNLMWSTFGQTVQNRTCTDRSRIGQLVTC